jgi:hypothetical protein
MVPDIDILEMKDDLGSYLFSKGRTIKILESFKIGVATFLVRK